MTNKTYPRKVVLAENGHTNNPILDVTEDDDILLHTPLNMQQENLSLIKDSLEKTFKTAVGFSKDKSRYGVITLGFSDGLKQVLADNINENQCSVYKFIEGVAGQAPVEFTLKYFIAALRQVWKPNLFTGKDTRRAYEFMIITNDRPKSQEKYLEFLDLMFKSKLFEC